MMKYERSVALSSPCFLPGLLYPSLSALGGHTFGTSGAWRRHDCNAGKGTLRESVWPMLLCLSPLKPPTWLSGDLSTGRMFKCPFTVANSTAESSCSCLGDCRGGTSRVSGGPAAVQTSRLGSGSERRAGTYLWSLFGHWPEGNGELAPKRTGCPEWGSS